MRYLRRRVESLGRIRFVTGKVKRLLQSSDRSKIEGAILSDGTKLTGLEYLALNPHPGANGAPIPGAREVTTPDGKRLIEIPIPESPKPNSNASGSR